MTKHTKKRQKRQKPPQPRRTLVKSSKIVDFRVQKIRGCVISAGKCQLRCKGLSRLVKSSQVAEKRVEKMSAELVKSSQVAEKRVQKMSADYIVLVKSSQVIYS